MSSQKNSTIESLENDYWKAPNIFPSKLVKDVFDLRKKPLIDLNSNEVRLLLSQDVGTEYLMPIALKILESEVLHEAFYYPGDLLATVLSVNPNYWQTNVGQLGRILTLLDDSPFDENEMKDEVDEEVFGKIQEFVNRYTGQMR